MDQNLTRYIWKHTRPQQLWILLVIAASMYTYFLSFDLPKLIINGPIQGNGFENPGDAQPYLRLAWDIPLIGNVSLFEGFAFERMDALWFLCALFLLLVIVNGWFKFYINTYKGRLGERMLRRIRFELVDRVLRFPPSQFRRLKPAEIATMVKDEVEPLGGFTGDAFVQPALLGGQALTALVFILVQNVWLGLISAAIVAVQILIIPRMRKRLLRLGRERQLTARELSGRIGEISEGINAVHVHDTSNLERAEVSARLGRIFKIRYDLYQWKFLVKFINNFLAQVTPFLFYLIGGYQVIRGDLDVGQLVAVIAAYKDLPGPLKELIDWDQIRQDVAVKYAQVYEQFNVENMIDPEVQALDRGRPGAISVPIAISNLSITDESGAKLLEHVSLNLAPGETVAVVGTAGGGGEFLADALARAVWASGGRIAIGSRNLHDMPESVTGRRMSYAGSDAYLFQGSILDNLLYSLKHAPVADPVYDGKAAQHRKWEIAEARRSGNSELDIGSSWIDHEAAGAANPADLLRAAVATLDLVSLADEIFELGLRSRLATGNDEALAARIVSLRDALRKHLSSEDASGLVVPFEPDSYNTEAKISENLLFGAAVDTSLSDDNLIRNPYFLDVLKSTGMDKALFEAGIKIAGNAVELFRDLPPDHPFFQQLTFMAPEEIGEYEALLTRLKGRAIGQVAQDEWARIVALSFGYIEPRHRFGVLDDELKAGIVYARKKFHADLPPELSRSIEVYDPEKFNWAASLMDNILLGRIGQQFADGVGKVNQIVRRLLRDSGLYQSIIEIGLQFNVGVGGRRLTAAQRQKLNLARALLKRSDFVILNRPLASLDQKIQRAIAERVLEFARNEPGKPAVLWVLGNAELASIFDRVIVFDRGSVAGDGTYDRLKSDNAVFQQLLA